MRRLFLFFAAIAMTAMCVAQVPNVLGITYGQSRKSAIEEMQLRYGRDRVTYTEHGMLMVFDVTFEGKVFESMVMGFQYYDGEYRVNSIDLMYTTKDYADAIALFDTMERTLRKKYGPGCPYQHKEKKGMKVIGFGKHCQTYREFAVNLDMYYDDWYFVMLKYPPVKLPIEK